MTLLLASTLLAAAAGVIVVLPILSRRAAVLRDVTSGDILDAEARKRVVLSELKELEYDFLGGKLDEHDYHELRNQLAAEAVAAVRAADHARAPATHTSMRASSGVAGGAGPDAAPSATQRPGWTAHACGFANPEGSRFCAGCGTRLL